MSFLAFALDNSGCMRRMRPTWLSILLVISYFNLSVNKFFDENSLYIGCFSNIGAM